MKRAVAFLRERAGIGASSPPLIEGGASFAYVFGTVLVFLLGIQAITGLALAAFYSPSASDAWGSVAYLQDQVPWGWFVRGLHFHGGGALVVVAGLHLVQTALSGAYKRPRELVWWLGLLLLVLVLVWAVTGYVLRWDQAGYWANRVEIGIAAGTPLIGDAIRELAIGGNDYGNLTLTRFYMLHVIALPAVVTLVTVAHIAIARRHGIAPLRARRSVARWPHQAVRDATAMALVFAVLLPIVIVNHGVDLAAPADPSQAYDARPLWYFRWLFEIRELAGSAEKLAAMAAPAVVAGFLVMLPLLDRRPERAIRARALWLVALASLFVVIAALTAMSFARDRNDDALAKRVAEADALANRARGLARDYGVPAAGGAEIWSVAPMWRARTLFAKMCAGCHDSASDPKDRIGPLIGPGHGDRAWLRGFLKSPNDPAYWGKTKLAKTEAAMKAIDLDGPQLDGLVELLVAQSGAQEIDQAKLATGKQAFEMCSDCHSLEEGVAGTSGPNLAGLHSRAFYVSFLGNPKLPIHMGADKSEMPRFDTDLTVVDRDLLAEFLVWLRTATPAQLDKLGPL